MAGKADDRSTTDAANRIKPGMARAVVPPPARPVEQPDVAEEHLVDIFRWLAKGVDADSARLFKPLGDAFPGVLTRFKASFLAIAAIIKELGRENPLETRKEATFVVTILEGLLSAASEPLLRIVEAEDIPKYDRLQAAIGLAASPRRPGTNFSRGSYNIIIRQLCETVLDSGNTSDYPGAAMALAIIGEPAKKAAPSLIRAWRNTDDATTKAPIEESLRYIVGYSKCCDIIDNINNVELSEYDLLGYGGPVPSLDDKIKELIPDLPEDFDNRALALAALNAASRRVIAAELAPALNQRIQDIPRDTLEQKKELARWVNDGLERFGLAVQCPNTGRPAKFRATTGGSSWPDVGRFYFETYRDGKPAKTAYSENLPKLNLIDAAPPKEPEVDWQQAVGPKASRRGRTRS
jgi:hypothetical protein